MTQQLRRVTTILSDFEILELVGTGAFSHVFKAKSRKGLYNNEFVAVKAIDLEGMNQVPNINIMQEIEIHCKVSDHPNIVQLYDHFERDGFLFIVLYLCNGGTLRMLIDGFNTLPIEIVRYFTGEIVKGIIELHEKGVVHRDFKAANIFLQFPNVEEPILDYSKVYAKLMHRFEEFKPLVMIGDFGFAREFENNMNTYAGTPLFMSPELLMGQEYTYKTDLWSLGVIMYKMIVGTYPVVAGTIPLLQRKIREPIDYSQVPHEIKPLLKGLLSLNAEDRITIEELLTDPFFDSLNTSNFSDIKALQAQWSVEFKVILSYMACLGLKLRIIGFKILYDSSLKINHFLNFEFLKYLKILNLKLPRHFSEPDNEDYQQLIDCLINLEIKFNLY
ncbi:hypothetical protein PCE1_000218 [Barthelona sp. PCE]